MKKSMILLAGMCYVIGLAAIIEGICKGIYINGIIVGGSILWLGNQFRKEAKHYE